MGFKLKKKESVRVGLRRIAREEIDEALKLLEKKPADPEQTVHELRKHLKKLRAVARLVRDELGEAFDRDDAAAQEIGRRLAPVREASARVFTLGLLRSKYAKGFPSEGARLIEKRLVARRRAVLGKLERGSTFSALARDLAALRRRVRTWPIQKEGFACLEPGLRRGYRKGRRAEPRAFASRADEDFHDWRKRAKDLRYHVELLEPIWPATMTGLEKTLHDLTDRLGDDHDLADLRAALTVSPKLTAGAAGTTKLVELIDRRRSELQQDARPLATRIYGETPRSFDGRIGSYFE